MNVSTTIRCQYASEVANLAERLVAETGGDVRLAQDLQATLFHRLIHWICRAGTHFINADRALERLERMGRRVLRRHLSKADAAPSIGQPIPIGRLLKTWLQLSYLEQRVMKLLDLKYSVEDAGLVLGISSNAVEYYRSQAAGKIHKAYSAVR